MSSDAKPTLFAQFVAQPGSFDALLEKLTPLVDSAEQEEGLVVYRLHASSDKTSIWFYEQYADDAAAEAHRANPALRAILGESQSLIASTNVVDGRLLGLKNEGK